MFQKLTDPTIVDVRSNWRIDSVVRTTRDVGLLVTGFVYVETDRMTRSALFGESGVTYGRISIVRETDLDARSMM